jgi:hypothetical protein
MRTRVATERSSPVSGIPRNPEVLERKPSSSQLSASSDDESFYRLIFLPVLPHSRPDQASAAVLFALCTTTCLLLHKSPLHPEVLAPKRPIEKDSAVSILACKLLLPERERGRSFRALRPIASLICTDQRPVDRKGQPATSERRKRRGATVRPPGKLQPEERLNYAGQDESLSCG